MRKFLQRRIFGIEHRQHQILTGVEVVPGVGAVNIRFPEMGVIKRFPGVDVVNIRFPGVGIINTVPVTGF